MAKRGPVKFGFHSAHDLVKKALISETKIMASRLKKSGTNFLAGTIDEAFVESLKKNIVFKIICNEKEGEEFDEYVILCLDIHIIRDNSESNTVNNKKAKT